MLIFYHGATETFLGYQGTVTKDSLGTFAIKK